MSTLSTGPSFSPGATMMLRIMPIRSITRLGAQKSTDIALIRMRFRRLLLSRSNIHSTAPQHRRPADFFTATLRDRATTRSSEPMPHAFVPRFCTMSSLRNRRGIGTAGGTTQLSNREPPSLPEGYRTAQVAGAWYLFNPWDVLVAGPTDAVSTLQRHAWYDAWRRIDSELHEEAAALYDDTRPLQELPRLRQFFQMVDPGAKSDPESKDWSTAVTPTGWWRSVVAGSLTVIAAFMAATARLAPDSQRPTARMVGHELSTSVSVVVPRNPSSRPYRTTVVTVPRTSRKMQAHTTTSHFRRPPTAAYVVIVGKFGSSATAEAVMRSIKRKGYVVRIVPHGAFSEVMTPPMRTRTQAESVLRGLEAVGLQAKLMAWREPQ